MSDVDPALVGPASAIKPDAPTGQETPAAEIDAAVAAAENLAARPSLASVDAALAAGQILAASPTVGVVKADAPALIQEAKAGWKTTEFWGAVAAALANVLTTLPYHDKALVTGIAALYAVGRGLAKSGSANVTPVAPE
jgi:hypothetical protein